MVQTAFRPLPAGIGARLDHFGPATVVAVINRNVELETPKGDRRWAQLAIPAVYQPQPGDVVLAIAADDDCYVIGVLDGRGPTVLQALGDLDLRAPNGSIHIAAAQGCTMAGPVVRIQAVNLDLAGDTLHHEFTTVRSRISGMLDISATAICTVVAETYRLAAHRIVGRGKETVTIEAPAINIG